MASGPHARPRRPAAGLHGAWRNRVRHRPDPGGGAVRSRVAEPAPVVLLVDDEHAIRTICRVNLEGDGLVVLEAADGDEALAQLGKQSPSLVLLDVMMPGADGWSVAERLATDPATRHIPVIFLSALATREDRLRAQKLGAVGYIVKPFDPRELADAVRTALERIGRGERELLNSELFQEE